MWPWDASWETVWGRFSNPRIISCFQDYELFPLDLFQVSCLITFSLSRIIHFFCSTCRDLLLFYSSCLLHVMTDISWVNNIPFVFKVFHHANICASQVALVIKNLPANAGDVRDVGLIPGSRISPEGGNGKLLQYSCLENCVDRGAWQTIVYGVTKC